MLKLPVESKVALAVSVVFTILKLLIAMACVPLTSERLEPFNVIASIVPAAAKARLKFPPNCKSAKPVSLMVNDMPTLAEKLVAVPLMFPTVRLPFTVSPPMSEQLLKPMVADVVLVWSSVKVPLIAHGVSTATAVTRLWPEGASEVVRRLTDELSSRVNGDAATASAAELPTTSTPFTNPQNLRPAIMRPTTLPPQRTHCRSLSQRAWKVVHWHRRRLRPRKRTRQWRRHRQRQGDEK